jgi:hypothetical protein
MQPVMKKLLWIGLLMTAAFQAAWGFALWGPNPPSAASPDGWEQEIIGYQLPYTESLAFGGHVSLQDVGSPKNIGEEYRRNTRVLYYAYDPNFVGFFGSNGVAAADSAFAIMNSLTNVDSYSTALTEFPLEAEHINFTAQSLGLTDLKSITLHLLVEQLGLSQPERFTWTLHNRFLPPGGTCPLSMEYLVVQRNFDITASPLSQIQYSPYVNGTLYSYEIDEICSGNPELAVTVPFSVDPFADIYTAVAADPASGLEIGGFYTGLTRDDAAGLRYLLSTNNVNWETAAFIGTTATGNSGAGAAQLQNPGQTNVIQNFNLGAFLAAALTNDAATVAALFPNVVTAGSSNYFTTVCTPNIVSYLQNPPNGSPVGTPQQFIVTTNGFTCVPQTNFVYNLANVVSVTNAFANNTASFIQTISLTGQIGAPIGSSPVTNITLTPLVLTNVPPGDFFIVPPGLCGFNINTNPYILNGPVTATTNVLTTATNANGFVFSQSVVTYFTNHYYLAEPVSCTPFASGLYQGIENVKFVRADFDSLIGQTFQPITNVYTMVLVTNSQTVVQTFQRVVTTPDILLSAADLAVGPSGNGFSGTVERPAPNFDQDNVLNGLAGPGTINPGTTFTYNKVGALFFNAGLLSTNDFLSQFTQLQLLQWASFDASTNAPVLYPNGTSIQNLENELLIQISPPASALPVATHGAPYAVTFTTTGGAFTPPYTWSWTPLGSETLPPGLTLSSGGTLSGTPTQAGTFDFILQLNDSLTPPRTVQWNYSINIR